MHILITGPQGCGKNTMAEEIKKLVQNIGKKVILIDDGHHSTQEIQNEFDVVIETRI